MANRARLIIEWSDDAGRGHRGGIEGFLLRKADQIVRELVGRSDTCATATCHVEMDEDE